MLSATWIWIFASCCALTVRPDSVRGCWISIACPTPPMMPPSWISATTMNTSQNQHSQFTPARGPGTSLKPSSVVRPLVIVNRPNSICTKTLITHPMMISHSRTKPACAPTKVVAMSSPEPTMDPAMISPGPSCRRIPRIVVGGSAVSSGTLGLLIPAMLPRGGFPSIPMSAHHSRTCPFATSFSRSAA